MISRSKSYFRTNWGAPFLVAFALALASAAFAQGAGFAFYANYIAVYAYYLLVIGVALQIASYDSLRMKLENSFKLHWRKYLAIPLIALSLLAGATLITPPSKTVATPTWAQVCGNLAPGAQASGGNGPDWATDKSFFQKTVLCFDGVDDVITIKNSPSLNPSNLTLSVWAKFNGTWPASGNTAGLVIKRNNVTQQGASWQLEYSRTAIQFTYMSGGGFHGCVFSGLLLAPDRWYQIAVAFSGSLAVIYLDGDTVQICQSMPPLDTSFTSDVYIGRGAGGYSSAIISNVMLYNNKLSPDQVKQSFNQHVATAGLVLWLKLDDGSGTSLQDVSGNGNSGIFSG